VRPRSNGCSKFAAVTLGSSRALEQLLSVCPANFALRVSSQHPRDLVDSTRPLENGNVRRRHAAARALGNHYVMVSARRDLWQMRDRKNLMLFRYPSQCVAHLKTDPAADSCIHFVEDESRHLIDAGKYCLQ